MDDLLWYTWKFKGITPPLPAQTDKRIRWLKSVLIKTKTKQKQIKKIEMIWRCVEDFMIIKLLIVWIKITRMTVYMISFESSLQKKANRKKRKWKSNSNYIIYSLKRFCFLVSRLFVVRIVILSTKNEPAREKTSTHTSE